MEFFQKHCLFMLVLCMSNMTRPPQMSLRACVTKVYAATTSNHLVCKVIKTLCNAARDLGTGEYEL